MTYNDIRVSECCTKIKILADLLNYRAREGALETMKTELEILIAHAEEAKKILEKHINERA